MQIATIVFFLALIISAPWISRKWGAKGEWAWGIIAMAFLVTAILVLQ